MGVGVVDDDVELGVPGFAASQGRRHDHAVTEPELDVLELAVFALVQRVALEAERVAQEVDRGAQVAVRDDR
jgi:hypothetical protein